MNLDQLSPLQRMALVLDAPLSITGNPPRFYDLTTETENVADSLKSWWGVTTKADHDSMLHWLEEEGGHTAVYLDVLNTLEPLTYQERLARIEYINKSDANQGQRLELACRYYHDLGPYTIKAFDISRYAMLAKQGYMMGWYSEASLWSLLEKQAQQIIENKMFSSHADFLLSFYVGRTFAMNHGVGNVKESIRLLNLLMLDPSSPYLSFIDWSDIVGKASTEAAE